MKKQASRIVRLRTGLSVPSELLSKLPPRFQRALGRVTGPARSLSKQAGAIRLAKRWEITSSY
jgi:hypothetical protein